MIDGSILKGQILTTEKNAETIEIQLESGIKMTVPESSIAKIKTSKRAFQSIENGVQIQSKGLYLLSQIYLLSAQRAKVWVDDSDDIRHATGVSFTGGYQFFRYFAVGLGTGLNLYENIQIPVFLDIRGNLTQTNPTIFYAFNGGYSLNAENWLLDNNDQVDYSGGYFYHPALGLKFNARNNMNFQFDIGYNFQHQERTFLANLWDSTTTTDRIIYKSLAIRVGVSF